MTRRLNRLKQTGKLIKQHKFNKIKMLSQKLNNANANIQSMSKIEMNQSKNPFTN